jgi:hypothetical protein
MTMTHRFNLNPATGVSFDCLTPAETYSAFVLIVLLAVGLVAVLVGTIALWSGLAAGIIFALHATDYQAR